LAGSSLEGRSGEASMSFSAVRAWGGGLIRRRDAQSRADARRCRSRFRPANLCAVWPMPLRLFDVTMPLLAADGAADAVCSLSRRTRVYPSSAHEAGRSRINPTSAGRGVGCGVMVHR
jgi:hypothetical protein